MKLSLIKNGKVIAYIRTADLTGAVLLELQSRGYLLGIGPLNYFEVMRAAA